MNYKEIEVESKHQLKEILESGVNLYNGEGFEFFYDEDFVFNSGSPFRKRNKNSHLLFESEAIGFLDWEIKKWYRLLDKHEQDLLNLIEEIKENRGVVCYVSDHYEIPDKDKFSTILLLFADDLDEDADGEYVYFSGWNYATKVIQN